MLAAIVCLALAQTNPPRTSGDGNVADVIEPTLLAIIPYNENTRDRLTADLAQGKKVEVPTFTVRLDGVIPPDRKSPAYRKALDFAREMWGIPKGGFTLKQRVELGYPGPRICEYSLQRKNKKGEWLGHVGYYRSEPSVDFQFRTWTESFDEKLIENGYAKVGDISSVGDPATREYWKTLESQAKQKKLGMWADK